MKKEVLNLGKMLVNELGLDDSVDTLSRWMAHYIAQQMIEIENYYGEERVKAEEKCFETILELWKHRVYYEPNKNPFKRFEVIFKTLEQLEAHKEKYFFLNEHNREDFQNESEEESTINNLMGMVIDIDKIARIWIKYILKQAALYATDEKTLEWIKASTVEIEDNLDTRIIINLLEGNLEYDEDTKKKVAQERIEQLKKFRDLNEDLIRMYSEEL